MLLSDATKGLVACRTSLWGVLVCVIMKKYSAWGVILMGLAVVTFELFSCSPVNTNSNPHFDEDGYIIKDTLSKEFKMEEPSKVNFYVEVSGSMNGFFRANQQTYFKADLWKILSFFSPVSSGVSVLTNDGNQGAHFSNQEFRNMMNTGSFISSASTKVPLMLQTIISELGEDSSAVAVLVSDMKYSPVGSLAPNVLMTQYSSDVSSILGEFGQSASLICATSNYLDKNSQVVCERSPYYYLILGRPECVAMTRNRISSLLELEGHFVDNIDTGFDFGAPRYSFGVANKCSQLNDQPTFVDYEEADGVDTCTIKLKVNLEDYRWIMANDTCFKTAFKCKATYGSEVKVKSVSIDVKNITGAEKDLNRGAVATVDLQIYNMATDSEVIEWSLDLPNTNYGLFQEFFNDAYDENDPTKSFSVVDFIKGMFQGGIVNKDTKPNYILVSKES